ncbi:hypothetical protein T484DRAFT_1859893, partial [Baffinella frigidus]
MGFAPACESSSDHDRPLKGLPIKLWFDNPAYCISFDKKSWAASLQRQTDAQTRTSSTAASGAGTAPRRKSLPDTFLEQESFEARLSHWRSAGWNLEQGSSLVSYCREMASQRSSDPDRPLKGLPIRLWFDNPEYSIAGSVSPAVPFAAGNERLEVPGPAVSASHRTMFVAEGCGARPHRGSLPETTSNASRPRTSQMAPSPSLRRPKTSKSDNLFSNLGLRHTMSFPKNFPGASAGAGVPAFGPTPAAPAFRATTASPALGAAPAPALGATASASRLVTAP